MVKKTVQTSKTSMHKTEPCIFIFLNLLDFNFPVSRKWNQNQNRQRKKILLDKNTNRKTGWSITTAISWPISLSLFQLSLAML